MAGIPGYRIGNSVNVPRKTLGQFRCGRVPADEFEISVFATSVGKILADAMEGLQDGPLPRNGAERRPTEEY